MANFNVTNLFDSGAGSLRQAILDANSTSGADIISFDNLLSGGSINLTSGQLSITDSLIINGLGANFLTVDAGNQGFRVFNIDDGTANLIDVFINGLTITGGNLFDSSGGGILSRENLTVSNSTISGNTVTAAFDRGGGIFNERGMLTVNNSIISGNTASGGLGFGGGISTFDGTVTITDSTISGNTSGRDGGGISTAFSTVTITNSSISGNTAESGGGIYHSLGTFTLTNSTISDNLASLDGGGISTRDPMTVTNSTISGNTSGRDGGGIDNGDVLTVTNSTISGNTAQNSGGGINNRFDGNITVTNSSISGNTAQSGGGIDNSISFPGNNPIANINNTIIAGNNGTNPDVVGNFNSNGFNLIGNATGSTGFGGTDLIGVDPLLGSLANNGGSTLTLALLPGSSAIDAGSNAAVPPGVTTDQRGAGFERIVNGTVDIGAFEVQQLPPPVSVPEPSSLMGLVAFGVGALTISKRKLAKMNKKTKDKNKTQE